MYPGSATITATSATSLPLSFLVVERSRRVASSLLHFPLVLNKIESSVFERCSFSLFLKDQFFQIIFWHSYMNTDKKMIHGIFRLQAYKGSAPSLGNFANVLNLTLLKYLFLTKTKTNMFLKRL